MSNQAVMNTEETETVGRTGRGFEIHSLTTAPEGSREVASALHKAFGGVLPNLVGVLAGSPEAIKASATLSQIVGGSSLSALEQQVIEIAVSRENRCDYCLVAHTFLSRQLPQQPIQAARDGSRADDPKLEALRRFATKLVAKKGLLSQDELSEFRNAGLTNRQALEVIVVIALKTIHNLVNNLAGTPIDSFFTKA